MTATAIDFERALNPEQRRATTHGDGPLLVLAGAGSGKTRVITYRIAWLVRHHGVAPDAITAMTFTNKAANEMKERAERLLGLYPLPAFVGTFHRFSLRMLRRWGQRVGLRRNFAIVDSGDQKTLIKKAIAAEDLDETAYTPQSVQSAISSAKNRLQGVAAYERDANDFFRQRVAKVYRRYQQLLMDASAVDFDDMIRLAVRLLEREEDVCRRVRAHAQHLLVDEFQDSNHAQMRLIHALVGRGGNIMAVGDEDQGIYRWRGAELDNILRFEKAFEGATVLKLERNYRSTQNILAASGAVVARNTSRRGKTLWTEAGAGEQILLYRARDEQDEAGWVARSCQQMKADYGYHAMAVLVRTNAQTRAIEDAFLDRRIPYALIGGVRFYERAEIKDLVAYLRLLRNPHDPLSLSRVINKPPRGIGATTQKTLFALAAERGTSPWEALSTGNLEGLAERARRALRRFHDLLVGLTEDAQRLPLPALLEQLLEVTDYVSLYAKPSVENQARCENIDEFLSAVQEFTEKQTYGGPDDLLTAFLDHASLTADVDALDTGRGVSLMTLHSAKGLEFPLVVVAGLEDGLLPHFNAKRQVADVEEERRLLYVGMTRAEKRLLLTACRRRRIAGRYQDQQASPFLGEIPAELLDVEESPEVFTEAPAAAFGRPKGPRGSGSGGSYLAGDVHRFFGSDSAVLPEPAPRPASSRAPAAGSGALARANRRSPPAGDPELASAVVKKGSRVRHGTLGKGIVLGLEGEGDGLRLTVLFAGVGKRKLLARYANLEVLS